MHKPRFACYIVLQICPFVHGKLQHLYKEFNIFFSFLFLDTNYNKSIAKGDPNNCHGKTSCRPMGHQKNNTHQGIQLSISHNL